MTGDAQEQFEPFLRAKTGPEMPEDQAIEGLMRKVFTGLNEVKLLQLRTLPPVQLIPEICPNSFQIMKHSSTTGR